jgi:L-iditol 2-dehydrogenase
LRLYGAARIFAIDGLANRRVLASKLGADFSLDPGMNVLQAVLKESALGVVRKGGRIILFGAPARGAHLSLDVSRLFLREITLQSSYSTSETEMQMALEFIVKKRIDLSIMITHRLPLNKIQEAFRVAQDGRMAGKVIVENS